MDWLTRRPPGPNSGAASRVYVCWTDIDDFVGTLYEKLQCQSDDRIQPDLLGTSCLSVCTRTQVLPKEKCLLAMPKVVISLYQVLFARLLAPLPLSP